MSAKLSVFPKICKRAYDKNIKLKNWTVRDKIWLNSEYIITKQNQKLEIQFFRLFQVLVLLKKEGYKLEFLENS